MSEARARARTAEEIIDVAEVLIETRGYSAFSYRDIAEALGIRKASIHYHFPSKTDLGVATIERYRARFDAALQSLECDPDKSAMVLFECYTGPYRAFADTSDRICLCGALAGELPALPSEMQACVRRFFDAHQSWLARILRRGRDSGEFEFQAPVAKMARAVFSALQGALLVKRTTGNATQLNDVIAIVKAQLTGSP
jgi:TetR/AcrR family transcriptional regulator, transcriptional repressor for nem operon